MKAGVDYEAITVDEHASILRSTENYHVCTE